jgi:beta-lactamase superfamily II metal-dependent hydrolase
MDKKTTIILILIILTIGTIIYFIGFNPYKFNLYVLNVGKADCSFIKYEDKVIVIDTGEESSYEKIDRMFKLYKIDHIDHLIITHFDKDHVGSASMIINNYDVKNVYQTNLSKDNEYYNKYIEALNNKGITPITIENDYNIDINKLNIVINGPNKEYEDDKYNNSSLITSIKYKKKSYLFMGDAMNDRIKDYMEDHINNKYDLIKLPHHGDYLSQDEKLIKKYKPKGVIVSSDNMDNKLSDLIKDKKLDLYYTNESDKFEFKEF